MAYLAVDADGSEHIFQSLPVRVGSSQNLLRSKKTYYSYFNYDLKQLAITGSKIKWRHKDDNIEDITVSIMDCNNDKLIDSTILNKYKDFNHWEIPTYEWWNGQVEEQDYNNIELPVGYIEKLVDKRITWYNEPIEI